MDVTFTTDVIEPNRKSEFWRQFVCEYIADIDCDIASGSQFQGEIRSFPLGSIVLSIIRAGPHTAYRKEDRIKRAGTDYFLVIFQTAGSADYEQNGIVSRLDAGDFVLYDPCLPYRMKLLNQFEHITLRVPRHHFAMLEADVTSHLGRKVCASSVNGELGYNLISSLVGRIDEIDPFALYSFVETALPIIVQAFVHEHDDQSGALVQNSMQTLTRAKLFIAENLSEENLSLEVIADHLGISVRHLGRLFKKEGVSPAKWLKSMRLERCASALVHPMHAEKNITEIAYMRGFGDISHFCKDFKRAYGYSPSQYRERYSIVDIGPRNTS